MQQSPSSGDNDSKNRNQTCDRTYRTRVNHQYYEEKNRDLIDRLAKQPPKPGQEKIRAKLKAAKAKLASQL